MFFKRLESKISTPCAIEHIQILLEIQIFQQTIMTYII
jgi:hypothetical protein